MNNSSIEEMLGTVAMVTAQGGMDRHTWRWLGIALLFLIGTFFGLVSLSLFLIGTFRSCIWGTYFSHDESCNLLRNLIWDLYLKDLLFTNSILCPRIPLSMIPLSRIHIVPECPCSCIITFSWIPGCFYYHSNHSTNNIFDKIRECY